MKSSNESATALKPNERSKAPFWKTDVNGKIKIDQYRLIKFLQEGGFFKTTTKNGKTIVRVQKNIISEAPDFVIIDYLKKYLTSKSQLDVLEVFSRGVSGYINTAKLNLLDTVKVPVDKDPKDESWFYYKNTAVKVSKNGVEIIGYENLPHKIWDSRILDRDFEQADGTKSDFYDFLNNLAGQDNERFISLKTIVGYLQHRYQNKSLTRAVILVDQNISFDGKANGGSGKTLVTEAIGKTRELVGMDGKNMKTGSWFKNQRIERTTDVIRYDDVQRDFSLETLYSMITSGVTIERKYKDEFYISPENAPKIVISSNYPVNGTGGSTDERRRCEYEVANHYDADHQPIDDYQKHFFDDWDKDEWNKFDALMMHCVQVYFREGLVIPNPINLVKNKLLNNTCLEFVEYLDASLLVDQWIDKREYQRKFIEHYPIHKHLSPHQFTKWLKEFAASKNLHYKDRSAGGKYLFILETKKIDGDEK